MSFALLFAWVWHFELQFSQKMLVDVRCKVHFCIWNLVILAAKRTASKSGGEMGQTDL